MTSGDCILHMMKFDVIVLHPWQVDLLSVVGKLKGALVIVEYPYKVLKAQLEWCKELADIKCLFNCLRYCS